MQELAERIAALLAEEPTGLTISVIADKLGVSAHDVDRLIWADPKRFAWQPGHCWTLGTEKPRPVPARSAVAKGDSRARPWAPAEQVQLRAITLASGVILKVSRRPLDTHAFFSVRSAGNEVELILNSTHELFVELPMPFEEGAVASQGYKKLSELLLEAWALYEDTIPGGSSRRAAEDIRLLWGRRATELLRDVADGD